MWTGDTHTQNLRPREVEAEGSQPGTRDPVSSFLFFTEMKFPTKAALKEKGLLAQIKVPSIVVGKWRQQQEEPEAAGHFPPTARKQR